ncbi:hypothetical protein NG701_07440 [Pseudarthrobacter sp. HLT3-5]|uniref:phage tail protein n=1 Tax=Pseudarthrobacter cellobiosi TaxID=2953654 RepID=UPI00208F1C23|nr:hypothetical protein [Pseudarthrobacter sp. HLT3-5]MCO4274261.1 hypothetical protein [Pseudarthrobacter sp. HLT3-5]
MFFDASSFSGNGFTVTVNAFSTIRHLNASSLNDSMTIAGSVDLVVYGNVTLSSLLTMTTPLLIRSTNCLFTRSSATLNTSVTLGNSATLELNDAFAANSLNFGIVSGIYSGSLFTNNYPITVAAISFYRALNIFFGTSVVTLTGSGITVIDYTGTNIYSNSATFIMTGTGVLNLNYEDVGTLEIYGTTTVTTSHTFNTLKLYPGSTLISTVGGMSATTQTITNFIANGTAAAPITIKSSSVGLQHVLRKTSGTVDAYYLHLQDSAASGGATWNNIGGVNNGNNSGWNFLAPPLPTWDFIDSTASVFQPTLTPGVSTMSPNFIDSTSTVYSAINTMYLSGGTFIDSTASVYAPVLTQLPPPPPPPTDWEAIGKEDEKVYVYKVYTSTGTFIGIWTDVRDNLKFTRKINTPGTTTTIILARSPNTTKEVRANLTTEAGEPITTEDGDRLTVTYETNNSVGEGTDVDINYKVDVYVHYGEFQRLVTEAGEPLTTEDGEYLLAASGAPSGVRVFSGTILDYRSTYAEETGVMVTLASHGLALSNELVRSGETTTVNYSSQPLQTTLKSVLDSNPQVMTYSTDSIAAPGVSAAFKFELSTKLEAVERVYEQSPDGWYWYGDVADNFIYMQPTASTPHHMFKKGYHVKSLDLTRSKEQLINRVYFIGGEVAGVPVFKKYEDAASIAQWGVGLHRIVDRRFTDAAAMQRKAMKLINRFKNPIYTTPITISSARYDLESIREGQVVGFANYGNFVDDLLLQIVSLSYTPTAVTLEVGDVLQAQHERIEEISDELQGEQYQNLPTAPV